VRAWTISSSWTPPSWTAGHAARVVLAGRPENGEPGFVDRVGRSANVDGYRVTLSEWSGALRLANSLVWAGASPQGTMAVEDQEVHIPDVADRDLLSPQEMAALVEDLVAEERGARQAAADAAAAATPPRRPWNGRSLPRTLRRGPRLWLLRKRAPHLGGTG
jgi:hypothetical protein